MAGDAAVSAGEAAGAGVGAGVATGAVAGAASSFLPQAAKATAATRAAIMSDLFMFVLS